MKKRTIEIIAIICALCAHSNNSNASELQLSAGLMRFDYTEFDTNGQRLDRETGWIPGIGLGLHSRPGEHINVSFDISRHDGAADYNGQTQAGDPHITRTDETIERIGARLALVVKGNAELFAAFHYQSWQRDIRNNIGVSGFNVYGAYEKYTWQEISAGAKAQIWRQDKQQLFLELGLLRTLEPEIFVDLSRFNGGTTTLQLEEKSGARIRLEWIERTNDTFQYGLTSWLEYWKFGRSNTRITQGGSPNYFVTEPSSETRNIGIKFVIVNNF